MKLKRLVWLSLTLLITILGLAACGNDATNTPVGPTPTAGNPILATITAGANGNSKAGPAPAPTPAITLPAPSASLPGVPLYTGLKPIDLGVYGSQMAVQFSQASPKAKTAFYYTGDGVDKLGAFYNSEMPKQGFAKTTEAGLPASSLLDGKVFIYSKSDANLVIITIGPLDAALIGTLGQGSPAAASLKPGDTLVVLLNGLTAGNLTDLQKTLGSS